MATTTTDIRAQVQLSAEDVSSFEAFGFLRLEKLLRGDIADVRASFEAVMRTRDVSVLRCDEYYDTSRTECGRSPRLTVPITDDLDHPLAWLRNDRRLHAVAASLLGGCCYCTSSTANFFNCDTYWHDDGVFTTAASRDLAFMIYLDPLAATSGALRVIPGSHMRGPFRKALRQSLTKNVSRPRSHAFGVASDQVPAYVLDVEPGDVVVLNLEVLHASFGGAAGRRLITLGFGTLPENEVVRTAMEGAVPADPRDLVRLGVT